MKKKTLWLLCAICGFSACADTDMEQLTMQEPESVAAYDYLKDYDVLKAYSEHIGATMDAKAFLEKGMEYRIAVANFTELVPGSAFAHGQVVKANGNIDTTTIANVKAVAAQHDMALIGTPLVWHRQQNTTYLNTRISPNVIRPEGDDGGYCLKMTNTALSSNINDAQVIHTFVKTPQVEPGITYKLKMMIRGTAEGTIQVLTYSNGKGSRFAPNVDVTKEWTQVEMTNTMASGIKGLTSILFCLGQYLGTIYIDNIELVEWNTVSQKEIGRNLNTMNYDLDDAEQTAASITVQTDTNGSLEDVACSELGEGYDPQATYVEKTDEEKRIILTTELQRFIKGMTEAGKDAVSDWVVVKEPLASNTGDVTEFFWQDYLGSTEYAVLAFKEAKQSTSGKLYIEESGLTDDLSKCAKLMEFVSAVERQGAKVDGIAVSIDVDTETTKTETVGQLFQQLAASGKLIRISDLQVNIADGVTTDETTEAQLRQQATLVGEILNAYMSNVPVTQRGGIILHQVLDNQKPLGIWNREYKRKHVYGSIVEQIKKK